MAQEGFKRKLAAILSADVEGYSRLMDDDEEATVRTITSYRTAIADLVQQFRGRVVDTPGDNILTEFTSVVDAVNCAVKIQRDLAERNAELPDERKMQFRIGVNLGDVIEEDGRIYGDGINIAARVESLSEAGGICISGRAYDQVENKLGLEYENLGEHQVKNITRPIRVYRVLSYPGAAAHRVVQAKETLRHRWRKIGFAVALIVGIVVVLGVWQFYMHRSSVKPASVEKMAFPLPEKPSIAVLAFENMSEDPEQDYIADGISENIITALSHIPEMFVISRNSSFTYKGKPVKVQQVSEELGVRYVLEGSVLMSEERVRITAQLIDALTGGHIWSDRYDRDLNDLFNLLDEITLAIITELEVELTQGEQARIRTTDNLDAWRYLSKGRSYFLKFSKEGMATSRKFFKKALEKDPEYAGAVTMLAYTHWNDARFGYTKSRDESFKRAVELANKSAALDDNQPLVHDLFADIYFLQKQYEKAIEEGRKSIALGPNRSLGHMIFGNILYRTGHFEEAAQMCEKAIRLQPHTPPWYFGHMMNAYYWVERYEDSLAMAKQLIVGSKNAENWSFVSWGYWGSARAHIRLGKESDAREDVANYLKIRPGHSLDKDRRNSSYKPGVNEREYEDLRKAGFPDHPPTK